MAVCEKCWAEYRFRCFDEPSLTYSQVVAESDRRGGCTPEQICGDVHMIFDNMDTCRCGKVKRDEPAKEE